MKKLVSTLLLIGSLFVFNPGFAQQISQTPNDFDPAHGNSRYWVDIDNDGKDDFCTLYGNRDRLLCWQSLGDRFSNNKFVDANIGYPAGNKGGDDARARWVDLNGDGRVDLCRLIGSGKRPTSEGGGTYDKTLVCTYFDSNFSPSSFSLLLPGVRFFYEQNNINREIILIYGLSGADTELIYFSDVNDDGRQDVCYQHIDFGSASGTAATKGMSPVSSLRCRLNDGATFSSEITIIASYSHDDSEAHNSKAGFADFNGDGRADFCNRNGCHVRTGSGFSNYISFGDTGGVWFAGERYGSEGAAFVDFNGDGKVDFCGPTSFNRLICLLSNGKDNVRTAIFSANLDTGHMNTRWWVDINADGHPDYCRAVGNNVDYHEERVDRWGTLACRLGLGDGFSIHEIYVNDFNFGMTDGGRAFCDPWGTGVQTFCRSTRAEVTTTGPSTDPDVNRDVTFITYVHGLRLGLSDILQAEPTLMKSYSDGLGAETRLTYLPLTDDRVYTRSGFGNAPEFSMAKPRQMVVSETRAWLKEAGVDEKQWKPLTGNANYFYKDLLTHYQDGSRGFKQRYAFQEGNNTLEYTQFHQGPGIGVGRAERLARLGEVGTTVESRRYAIRNSFLQSVALTKGFEKAAAATAQKPAAADSSREVTVGKVFSKAVYDTSPLPDSFKPQHPLSLLQRSINTLGSRNRAGLLPITYTRETTASAWDLDGTVLPSGYSLTEIDDFGNITSLRQDTTASNGRVWSKLTTNTYTDNADKWLLGRLTHAKVVSSAPTPEQQLADLPRSSAGMAPNAAAMSPPTPVPTAPQPLSPAALSAILQLLLED